MVQVLLVAPNQRVKADQQTPELVSDLIKVRFPFLNPHQTVQKLQRLEYPEKSKFSGSRDPAPSSPGAERDAREGAGSGVAGAARDGRVHGEGRQAAYGESLTRRRAAVE